MVYWGVWWLWILSECDDCNDIVFVGVCVVYVGVCLGLVGSWWECWMEDGVCFFKVYYCMLW